MYTHMYNMSLSLYIYIYIYASGENRTGSVVVMRDAVNLT